MGGLKRCWGCWMWIVKRRQSIGKLVAVLIRPERVTLTGNEKNLKGRVADVIFQKNGFRVTLENGLYFFTSTTLQVGEEISFVVEAECLG